MCPGGPQGHISMYIQSAYRVYAKVATIATIVDSVILSIYTNKLHMAGDFCVFGLDILLQNLTKNLLTSHFKSK